MPIENAVVAVGAGFIPAKVSNGNDLLAGINPAPTKKNSIQSRYWPGFF